MDIDIDFPNDEILANGALLNYPNNTNLNTYFNSYPSSLNFGVIKIKKKIK